jgi:Fe-S oxidoreductase
MLQSAARLMAGQQTPTRDFDWLDDDLEVAEEGEIALFVGCLPFYDILFERELGIQTLEIARSAIRLLNRVGIQPVLLAEERCCGHDLLWTGETEAFEALAEANTHAFKASGVRHILTTCGECCRTWRIDYPEAIPDYRPKVEHLSEFLAARIEAGELVASSAQSGKVTYQDPCRLGRHLEVTEAPRQVLRAFGNGNGSGLVEMETAGRDALCCGTSGFIHCDANSRRLQSERLASAEATGAATLVTACPKCLIHFHCAQSEDRRRQRQVAEIEVQDLTVLAATALGRAQSADADLQQKKSTQQRTGEA